MKTDTDRLRDERGHPQQFRNLLDIHMCDDPAADPRRHTARETFLTKWAQALGFGDWCDAYHRFDPHETEADRLLRIAWEPSRTGHEDDDEDAWSGGFAKNH